MAEDGGGPGAMGEDRLAGPDPHRCPLPAGKERAHLAGVGCRRGVAGEVDATVDLVEATALEPDLDLASGDAGLQELPASHDAELPRGDDGDQAVS
jgi:hypothetical protein